MDAIKESFAAGLGIVPAYRYFVRKSALQLGLPSPTLPWGQSIVRGAKEGFPAISLIVGSQLFAQGKIEEAMAPFFKRESSPFLFPGVSSFLTGAATSPVLAFYNLLTMKTADQTYRQVAMLAVRKLTLGQVAAVAARETAFLYSIRVLGPLEALLMEGELIRYTSAFASGFFGSAACHSLDTAFTLWQRGHSITQLANFTKSDSSMEKATKCASILFRGWKSRAFGNGLFVCTFRLISQQLKDAEKIDR